MSNIEFIAKLLTKIRPMFDFLIASPVGNIIAIVVGIAWILFITSRKTDSDKRKEIREDLGKLLDKGCNILERLRSEAHGLKDLEREADEWLSDAQQFIFEALGESYLARWRNEINIVVQRLPDTSEERRTFLYSLLYYRVFRIEEMIKEFPF